MAAEAGEADSAGPASGRAAAVASAVFRPRRRVTRLWFGTKAPSGLRCGLPGESCLLRRARFLRHAYFGETLPGGREHAERAKWTMGKTVLTGGKGDR
ncbi:hypothetical protein GCM10010365_65670 [Streptomyces poonensis]|uniref:Uncharacterized protein n=1 Tax=Streptomyces poonensis TaxID=68255 RepID=A0A918UVF6_9ACTN|nr:hypothetical protein GCM10010365_65670 [Streptomyces poonensis]GLJ89628.1 hypothetical protein GCM10017589_22280 [Streptomyces poonensis]